MCVCESVSASAVSAKHLRKPLGFVCTSVKLSQRPSLVFAYTKMNCFPASPDVLSLNPNQTEPQISGEEAGAALLQKQISKTRWTAFPLREEITGKTSIYLTLVAAVAAISLASFSLSLFPQTRLNTMNIRSHAQQEDRRRKERRVGGADQDGSSDT